MRVIGKLKLVDRQKESCERIRCHAAWRFEYGESCTVGKTIQKLQFYCEVKYPYRDQNSHLSSAKGTMVKLQ